MVANAKDFNLVEALTGMTYPTEEVLVPLDLQKARDLNEKIEQRQYNARRDITDDELDDEIKLLKADIREHCLVVTIRGLSSDAQRVITDKSIEITNRKRPKDIPEQTWNLDCSLELSKLTWREYIIGISYGGAELDSVTASDVDTLFEHLPVESRNIVDKALQELAQDAMSGYEAAIKSQDF